MDYRRCRSYRVDAADRIELRLSGMQSIRPAVLFRRGSVVRSPAEPHDISMRLGNLRSRELNGESQDGPRQPAQQAALIDEDRVSSSVSSRSSRIRDSLRGQTCRRPPLESPQARHCSFRTSTDPSFPAGDKNKTPLETVLASKCPSLEGAKGFLQESRDAVPVDKLEFYRGVRLA